MMTLRVHGCSLLLLSLLAPLFLRADPTESLDAIYRRLQDHRGLAQHHAVVFEGEITGLQAIPRPSCKAGVEHRVTYRISEILWLEPDKPEAPGYTVSKGFIDCREQLLPSSPFVVGAKVLVYCETRRDFACLPPVELTNQNRMRLRSWLDQLRAAEGGPALLQIHEKLLQSVALLRKTPPGMPPVLNGETSHPFLFVGQVTSVQKLSDFPARIILPRLEMDFAVSHVLWGDYKDSVVRAWCNSPHCGGATSGETVIAHCYATRSRAECSAPAPYSEDALKKVETWIVEASSD
jgi:hypothetical protein